MNWYKFDSLVAIPNTAWSLSKDLFRILSPDIFRKGMDATI
jgi:hypothetical protein